MKLFRKIFLQVFIAFLILSQVIFSYLLYYSRKQSLDEIQKYEQLSFQEKCTQFSQIMGSSGKENDQKLEDIKAVVAFRKSFGSEGVLYRQDEELYNEFPYEFDTKGLRVYMGGNEEKISKESLVFKSGEKVYLVFFRDKDLYQIIYMKDITAFYDQVSRTFTNGFFFTLLSLVLIGVILFRALYRTMRPLEELKTAASSIADGTYGIRIPVRGKDEIAELAVSFNRMAGKVEEHMDKLEATNMAQRQLLGSLAHELKTPMTAIIGYADTLLTVRLSDRRREQALNYIANECRRLSSLSVKMLELSGLYETGEKTIEKKKICVAELFRRLQALTVFRLKQKQITLQFVCEPEDLVRDLDADLMMSLLINLVDNACKASPEGSTIWVRGDEKSFSVTDSGRGIPRDEIGRVTEAFYMVDKSRSRNAGSVGLGLTLCRQIAELHAAALKIESEEGKGTTVSVVWSGNRMEQNDTVG